MTRQSRIGFWLLVLTALLVIAACVLYVTGWIIWGQFLLVMASGTAGAGIVLFVERK